MKQLILLFSIIAFSNFSLKAQTDTIAPTALCAGSFFIYLDSSGQTTLQANQVDAGSFDNDTIITYTLSRSNFDCGMIGAQSVRLYVYDAAGNVDSCNNPIIVLDSIAPIVQCSDIQVHLDSNGVAIINETDQIIANSSAEFSATQGLDNWFYGVYPAFSSTSFSPLPNYTGFIWNNPGVGAILDLPQLDANGGHPQFEGLNWAVRRWISEYSGTILIEGDFFDRDLGGGDGAHVRIFRNGVQVYEYLNIPGSSTTYSITIDVLENDQIDFVIDPKFDASFDDTHFTQRIYIKGIDNGSFDNCPTLFYTLSQNLFGCSDVGQNAVQLTVTDSLGNSASCLSTITVIGTPSDTSFQTLFACDSIQYDGVWYYSNATIQNTIPIPGACDSLAVVIIDFTDTIDPVAVCGNITVYLDSSGVASISSLELDNGSSDNCSIAQINASQNQFDCAHLGSNPVSLVVADQYFNSDTCVGSVQVVDTFPPTPICQDLTVSLDASGFVYLHPLDQFITNSSSDFSINQGQSGWFYGVYSAFDVYNFDTLTYNGFVWNNPSSGAILDYPQLDANGGHPQFEGLRWAVRRWVSTVDGQIRIDGDFYDRDITGGDGAHVRIFKNGVQIYEYLNIPGNSVPYSITAKATAGDRFDFVIDPKFDAANDDTHFIINIEKMGINNGSFDNCSVDSLSINPSTLDCSNLGVNTVTLVATDQSGNQSSCSATITVESHVTYEDDSVSTCDPYTWIDGITYYSDTDTAFYLSSSSTNGCFDTISHLIFDLIETDTNVYLLGNTLYALDSTYTYQWYDCNSQSVINGQTGYFFTPTSNGSYAVIFDNNGCIDTSTCINVIVSSSEKIKDLSYRIAPNPFSDRFQVLFDRIQSNIEVQIFTVDGQLVRQAYFKNTQFIDLGEITERGLYIMEMICTDPYSGSIKYIDKVIKK